MLTEQQQTEVDDALELGWQAKPRQLPELALSWGEFSYERLCQLIDDDTAPRDRGD